MPSVLIVEDDPEMRAHLTRCIEAHPALTVQTSIGSLAAGMEALAGQPDVLLVDLGLPDGRGEQLIRAAMAEVPPPEVLVMTVFGDERHVLSAIEAGASGYLLKDTAADDVASAVLEVLAGGSPMTPAIARHILRRFQPPARVRPEGDVPKLTPREIEVLELAARGYTNAEIASLLGVSFHTITSHGKQIYRKLSVRSRSEAVFEATQLGIIDLHSPESS